MIEETYTISKAAKLLGVSPQTIRAWIKKGAIRPTRVAGGWYRFAESEIQRVQSGE